MLDVAHDISPQVRTMGRADELRALWLIARRGATESLRDKDDDPGQPALRFWPADPDRANGCPFQVALSAPGEEAALGQALAIYFLMLGLAPCSGAVGIACGQFAGEKEAGSLAPLLASPASNLAIFGGKILAAVLPALIFATVAEVTFVVNLLALIGTAGVRLLPGDLSLAMLAMVPGVAIFTSTIGSLVSSRVRTFNTAQQISGLVLAPFTGSLALLAFRLPHVGTLGLVAVIVGIFALDALLIVIAARTWRREEVLAGR